MPCNDHTIGKIEALDNNPPDRPDWLDAVVSAVSVPRFDATGPLLTLRERFEQASAILSKQVTEMTAKGRPTDAIEVTRQAAVRYYTAARGVSEILELHANEQFATLAAVLAGPAPTVKPKVTRGGATIAEDPLNGRD